MALDDANGDKFFEEAKAGGFLTEQTIPSGESVYIEDDTGAVVVGPYNVNGTLRNEGSLKVL